MSDRDSSVPLVLHQTNGRRKKRVFRAGDQFGSWTLVCEGEPRGYFARWWCRCDCGRLQLVAVSNIVRSGRRAVKRCQKCLRLRRSTSKRNISLLELTRRSYDSMRYRCFTRTSPSYHRYGWRGIGICVRWNSFENFLADMGLRPSRAHSLDRINNDGHYEPNNCRWATWKVQGQNKSTTKFLEHDGKRLCIAEWARIIGMTHGGLSQRLKNGMTVEQALTTPVRSTRPRKAP